MTSEPCRDATQETLHDVTLTHAFEIAATEATTEQYEALLGKPNVVSPKAIPCVGPGCPVRDVTWHEAAEFCNALSAAASLAKCYSCSGGTGGASLHCEPAAAYASSIYACPGYRLPTEAEWEYAYRAGTTTALYNGPLAGCDNDPNANAIGWNAYNADGHPHPAAGKLPNAWGLYDMAGNVHEWCHDWLKWDLGALPVVDPVGPVTSDNDTRVLRGGSWHQGASAMRGAARDGYYPSGRQDYGFRCARTLTP